MNKSAAPAEENNPTILNEYIGIIPIIVIIAGLLGLTVKFLDLPIDNRNVTGSPEPTESSRPPEWDEAPPPIESSSHSGLDEYPNDGSMSNE